VLAFLIRDAKAQGRNPWPWVIGTLFTGSIAPLLYFATAAEDSKEPAMAAAE